MTDDPLSTFKVWFAGFCAACGGDLEPDQWSALKARIGRLPDHMALPSAASMLPLVPRRDKMPDAPSTMSGETASRGSSGL